MNLNINLHEFSEVELNQAQSLSPTTILFLENEKAELVKKIVKLTYDSKDKEGYALQLSYLQGQLDTIEYLIVLSEDATTALNAQIIQSRYEQPRSEAPEAISPAELFNRFNNEEGNSSF